MFALHSEYIVQYIVVDVFLQKLSMRFCLYFHTLIFFGLCLP